MKEARSDSLYENVRLAGLLDETMERLLGGEKPAETVRWLKSQGVATSQAAVYAMVRKHGMAWRYDKAQEQARAEQLPEEMEASAAAVLRRRFVTMAMEASTLKELAVLAQIDEATKRTELEARRVKATETSVSLKVYQSQVKAAEMLEEILSEADRLKALQARREELGNASAADRVEALRLMLYQGAAEPKPETEAAA